MKTKKYFSMLRFRNGRLFKGISLALALTLICNLVIPIAAHALTSGPGQPEFTSFEPVETTQMVDPYSGDFTYNIPLISVPGPNGGYPINMSYHSNVGMDEEASWVGLGWSLNMGAINRQLRGLPDDFSGNKIAYESYIKPDYSFGLDIPVAKTTREFFGIPVSDDQVNPLNFHAQIYYNTYKGVGYRVSFVPKKIIPDFIPVSIGISYDSQGGFGIEPSLSLGKLFAMKGDAYGYGLGFSFGASASISSREGLEDVNFSASAVYKIRHHQNVGFGSSLSFSFQTTVPQPQMPITGKSGAFDIKFPIQTATNSPAVTFLPYKTKTKRWLYSTGQYSSSKAAYGSDVYQKSGYGYLNTPSISNQGDAVTDRSLDPISYSKAVPYLSPASYNYDLFNISGQGTGGMFRPYRSEISVLSAGETENTIEINNINYEAGYGSTTVHIGFDPDQSDGQAISYSGKWTDGNDLTMLYNNNDNNKFREPYYFQVYGEKSAVQLAESFLTTWAGDQAIRLKLGESNDWDTKRFTSDTKFVHSQGGTELVDASSSSVLKDKATRTKRSTNIEQLNNYAVSLYGFSKNTTYHDIATDTYISKINASSLLDHDYANALSEMSVVQPDGTRYIYGLPAINHSQEEASFRVKFESSAVVSAQSNNYEHQVSLLKTAACIDNNEFIGNNGGDQLPLDGYFQRTTLPGYAHSWLLTTVVSSDYVDLTGDGPSDDDYGYWVKFNYKKQFDNYKWRVPFADVSYNPGHIGDPADNMGSYMYGQKEIFYVESVETKTHLAVFHTSARKDAFESAGRLATAEGSSSELLGSQSMHRLDSINLFVKANYNADPETAIPLQTVHFDYDYSLCPGVPNNNQQTEYAQEESTTDLNAAHGKLTLKHLWFSYQSNFRGRLSPYSFDYGTSNPSYDPQAVDKWGNFRKTGNAAAEGPYYPVIRFPYTLQNITPDASTWLLSKITMPSGGKINVEYESDDYAYVQDKPALQMFDIVGTDQINSNPDRDFNGISNAAINATSHCTGDGTNYRIYFKMEHIPSSEDLAPYGGDTKQYVLDRYIHGLTKIYYNVEELLYTTDENNNLYDEVAGYADIVTTSGSGQDPYGVVLVGQNQTPTINAYITLKKEPLSEHNVFGDYIHPFQAGGFTHIRTQRPELIYPDQSNSTWSNSDGFATVNVWSLFGFVPDAYRAAMGINRYLREFGFCQSINLNGRSIIRLSAPDTKVGGGSRVKKIYIEDNDFENSGDDSSYGQEFDYTISENGRTISSGVAYEPEIGGDENALRYPVEYTESHPLKTSLNLYTEQPILRNYYPGPSVGYRKVTIRSLVHDLATGAENAPDVCHSVAPIITYEFYTPKDFPVLPDETDISPSPAIWRGYMIPGILTKFRKSMARSQGYSIVLNDMAGKLRKLTTYVPANPDVTGSVDRIISQEEYFYKTKNPYSPTQKNELDCKVKVLGNRGACDEALLGETSEVFITMDENKSETETNTWNFNVALNASTAPYILPIPLPSLTRSEMSLKTSVTTKVIYRTGILIESRKFDGQATVITDNLLFDEATGAPLLTQVNNEFGDHIFDFSLPAHWFYSGMSAACTNQGFRLSGLSITPATGGRLDFYTYDAVVTEVFEPGDELWITPSNGIAYKGFVLEIISGPNDNAIRVIKEDGSYITTAVSSLKITRSGKRNQLTAPAGKVMTNVDPRLQNMCDLVGLTEFGKLHAMKGVLNASAVQYSNQWNKACGADCGSGNVSGDEINPFRSGMLGVWRPYKSYVYLDSRQQYDNIREDGTFNSFYLFDWDDPSSSNSRWKLSGTITKYSPQGFEIENKDALGIYSSALYGYNNSLVTAVANNSRYTEMIFDGFEDYPKSCTESHWTGLSTSPNISSTSAHTGNHSLSIPANGSFSFGITTTSASISDADNSGIDGFDASTSTNPNYVTLNDYGCNGVFTPVKDREYFVSAWVKETTSGLTYFPARYANSKIHLDYYTNSSMSSQVGSDDLATSSSEQIIDGWQRISGKVGIPSNAGYVVVSFQSTSSSTTACFDDFRMLPIKGAMRAYVYDPITLRHVADLDDNNFATFYVYDDEGKLILKRVETSQGIRTVQESRTGIKH